MARKDIHYSVTQLGTVLHVAAWHRMVYRDFVVKESCLTSGYHQ